MFRQRVEPAVRRFGCANRTSGAWSWVGSNVTSQSERAVAGSLDIGRRAPPTPAVGRQRLQEKAQL